MEGCKSHGMSDRRSHNVGEGGRLSTEKRIQLSVAQVVRLIDEMIEDPARFSQVSFLRTLSGVSRDALDDVLRVVERETSKYLATRNLGPATVQALVMREAAEERDVPVVILRGHEEALWDMMADRLANAILLCESQGVSILRLPRGAMRFFLFRTSDLEPLLSYLRLRTDLPQGIRGTLTLYDGGICWHTEAKTQVSVNVEGLEQYKGVALPADHLQTFPSIEAITLGEITRLKCPGYLYRMDNETCQGLLERNGVKLMVAKNQLGQSLGVVQGSRIGPFEDSRNRNWVDDIIYVLGYLKNVRDCKVFFAPQTALVIRGSFERVVRKLSETEPHLSKVTLLDYGEGAYVAALLP